MSSTSFNVPSLKLTSTVMGCVVAIHLLTAIVLVMVKTPVTTIKPLKITPPIEIQLVSEVTTIAEPVTAVAEVEPIKAPKPQSVSVPEVKPEPKKAVQPVVKKETSKPQVDTKPATVTTKVVESKPVIKQPIKSQESDAAAQASALAADNERQILAAQAEKATQQAHAKAMRESQAVADAKAKADREAQAESDAKASREAAQAAAREKANQQAAAASNTPVNFTATNANWASAPNFSFPARARRAAKSGETFRVVLILQVNKQGGIDNVSLAQSSGNAALDREAQQQVRTGKFKPFTKNGVPVVGNVTLPISYAVP
jgi:colicin import membrane protein/protein TonB